MVYKQILVPDKKNHSIEVPEKFFGKKIEVTVIEMDDDVKKHPSPPTGNTIAISELFENFGHAHDFPSSETIRQQTWPSKW